MAFIFVSFFSTRRGKKITGIILVFCFCIFMQARLKKYISLYKIEVKKEWEMEIILDWNTSKK